MGRKTTQKDAIEQVLQAAENPLLPKEILERARDQAPALGLATVYRSLKRLQEERRIKLVEIPGKSPRYESADRGHHHHFVCQDCGSVIDLKGCVGNLQKMVPSGYRIESHEITLFGHCDSCQN